MKIKFLKDHGKWKAGDVLPDVFRNHGLQLIEDGTAEEVGPAATKQREAKLPKEVFEKAKADSKK